MALIRRARAALVIAFAWAIAWTVGGFLVALSQYLRFAKTLNVSWTRPQIIGRICALALVWAVIGAVNGFFFSLILGTLGRRVRERLGILNIAAFGSLAGVLLPVVFGGLLLKYRMQSGESLPIREVLGVALVGAVLGAISAIATFGLAGAPLSAREAQADSGHPNAPPIA
jgi:hypothetical protein